MRCWKSKIEIVIDMEVTSSKELQSQKSERHFHLLPTPSTFVSVYYLRLKTSLSESRKAMKH